MTEMTYQPGDKVLIFGKDRAEVVRVFKNGKVRVAFWVQTLGMTTPELWQDNVWASILTPVT
jgi:hypothetical protein